MKLRYEKNIRVLTDLMGYCHLIGADAFNIDFDMQPNHTTIVLRTRLPEADPDHLKQLHKMLSIPRQREVEQYYWNLSGEEDIDNELSLAGMMIDEAIIDYTDGVLTIRTERTEQSPDE